MSLMSELRRKEIDNMTPEEWAAERASNDAFVKKYLDTRSIFDWKPQNEGSGKGWDHRRQHPHSSWPHGKDFLKKDYINRHWGPTDVVVDPSLSTPANEPAQLHSEVPGQSATMPSALAEETLLAQNPSFDIGAGHRGASRNAKIHNLTRNNPNSKEVDAARQILGGISLPTF